MIGEDGVEEFSLKKVNPLKPLSLRSLRLFLISACVPYKINVVEY